MVESEAVFLVTSPQPRPRTPVNTFVRLVSGRYTEEIAGSDDDLL